MAKSKTRAANVPVPQSREELRDFVSRIGFATREVARIQAKLDDKVERMKKTAAAMSKKHTTAIAELTEGARIYCEANRVEMTNGDKRKSFETGAGVVGWRSDPPSVRARTGWKVEALIDFLKRKAMKKFIRVKEEIDREKMHSATDAERAALAEAFHINSAGESFFVDPAETPMGDAL